MNTLLVHVLLMRRDDRAVTHPSAELMAAHLDGRLGRAERDRLVQHLAECGGCRREFEATSRLLQVHGPAIDVRPQRWKKFASAASLAVIAAALVLVVRPMQTRDEVPIAARPQRRAQPDAEAPITIVAPSDGERVGGEAPQLTWRAIGRGASFEVTLQDEVGRVVKTWSTTDTSVVLSGDVPLTVGATYFWTVDALRPDGTSTRSKAHRFVR